MAVAGSSFCKKEYRQRLQSWLYGRKGICKTDNLYTLPTYFSFSFGLRSLRRTAP
jgi:hypothetical protein